jgi:hypothetical protein
MYYTIADEGAAKEFNAERSGASHASAFCHKQSPLLQAVKRLTKNKIGIREAVYIDQTTMLISFDVNFRFLRKNKPELVANIMYTNSTAPSVDLKLNQ